MQLRVKNIPFHLLLVGLFLYLLLAPFLIHFPFAYIAIDFLLSAVLLSALFTLHKNKILQVISAILLFGILVSLWLNLSRVIHLPLNLSYSLLSVYLLFLVGSLLYRFFSAKKVTTEMIFAALCLYLLIGILWGAIYALIDSIIPGSFHGLLIETTHLPEMKLHSYIYFSFTTLTTLGYGDIVPQTLRAAALCQTEAIIGQFFTSVLIAQLIGIHVAQRLRRKK
ncbi:MAG: hypothetical protein S4CHLAM2_17050 [Chlamydiales bacterium]|nr:hypothetical protein [Chlamydiales bacterium]